LTPEPTKEFRAYVKIVEKSNILGCSQVVVQAAIFTNLILQGSGFKIYT